MIKAARAKGKYVEICKGHLDLFMDQGIHSRPRPPDLAIPEQVSEVSEATVIFCQCGSLRPSMYGANALHDVVPADRMRIPIAHLCSCVCGAAEFNCYSPVAFQPRLLRLSGCVNDLFLISLVSLFRTVVACFARPRFVYTLSLSHGRELPVGARFAGTPLSFVVMHFFTLECVLRL